MLSEDFWLESCLRRAGASVRGPAFHEAVQGLPEALGLRVATEGGTGGPSMVVIHFATIAPKLCSNLEGFRIRAQTVPQSTALEPRNYRGSELSDA